MSQSGTGGPVGAVLALPAEALSAAGNVANTVARVPGQIVGAATQPFLQTPFATNNPLSGAGGSTPVTQSTPSSGPTPGTAASSGLDPKTQMILSTLGGAGAGAGVRSAVEAMQAAQRGVPTGVYGRGGDTGQQVKQLLDLIQMFGGGG